MLERTWRPKRADTSQNSSPVLVGNSACHRVQVLQQLAYPDSSPGVPVLCGQAVRSVFIEHEQQLGQTQATF